jgi:anthranilate phosphoribosyltransferase
MKELLTKILHHLTLTEEEASSALSMILLGQVPMAQVAAFIALLSQRRLELQELAGFHKVLFERRNAVSLNSFDPLDVCGTGGDGKDTFNISTLSAFVLAGAGCQVAKHGNYSASSSCGSSNVLEALGIRFTSDSASLSRALESANICILHAPLFHPALKGLAPLRKELGFRTFLNLLGPLLNPADIKKQFVGVSDGGTLRLYDQFFRRRKTNYRIVHSIDGYDEISLTGEFLISSPRGIEGKRPEDLSLERVKPKDLFQTGGPAEGAKVFLQILEGKGTAEQERVVASNAAVALELVSPDQDFGERFERALTSLRSRRALQSFQTLRGMA